MCSCPLDEERYVVRMEAYPAFDPERIEAVDLDHDHLQAVAAELNQNDPHEDDSASAQGARLRFDLCPQCYGKFLKDPLGREAVRRLKFSKN